jgi:hypothetical protein
MGLKLTSFALSDPCKALSVELEDAADKLALWDVPVIEIDCNKTATFCNSFNVISHPTVRLFKGDDYSRYRGSFKASA